MNMTVWPLALGMPGGPELVFIVILILIFFGAKRLPEIARSLGKGVNEFKKAMHAANAEIESIAKDVKEEPKEKPKPADSAASAPRESRNEPPTAP